MKILLFANTEWYLYNFRRSLAAALRDGGHDVLLVSPPGPYGERLRSLGYRWFPAPMQRSSLNPIRELALVVWLWRLFRRERVDLVHGFTIKSAIYGAIAARLASVPARVSAVAGMGYVFISDSLKARVLRPVVRGLVRLTLGGQKARLILQNPDDVALFCREQLVPPENIRLIPGSGVDCERFQPSRDAAPDIRENGRFRVVLPARLLWYKGLAEFVEASRLLQAEGKAVDFLLAGEPDPGNPASVSKDIVDGWVEGGLVKWLGHVDDMATLFMNVDAVALPSYGEGLPKSLIEAAACALPLITTDMPGCREVVRDGVEGFLIPPKDARALADAIAHLAESPELCARLGKSARSRALSEYDERIVIRHTMEVYRELLPGL